MNNEIDLLDAYRNLLDKCKILANRWVMALPKYAGYSNYIDRVALTDDLKFIEFSVRPTCSGSSVSMKMTSDYLKDSSTLEKDSLEQYNKNIEDSNALHIRKAELLKYIMQIKGLISLNADSISLTCCESRPNIFINDKSLYQWLTSKAKPDNLPSEDDSTEIWEKFNKSLANKTWKIRYVISENNFKPKESFESIAIPIITGSLELDHIRGCYSEWTCGRGDIDFVIKGSHSILTELASYVGKYVWIKFD